MSLKLALTVSTLLISASFAQAKNFTLPAKGPMVTIEVPDDWNPQTDGKAMEGTSSDGKLFIRADIVQSKNLEDATLGAVKYLEDKGVKITHRNPIKDMQINGMKGFNLQMQGSDSIGPAQVSLSIFPSKDAQRWVMVTLWGDETIEGQNMDGLGGILDSLKLAN